MVASEKLNRALVQVGKLVEASERYLAVGRLDVRDSDARVPDQAKADAAKEREALLPRIPNLTVEANAAPDGASFSLDGVPFVPALMSMKQPANPGRHVVEGRSSELLVRKEMTLREARISRSCRMSRPAATTTGSLAAQSPRFSRSS